MSADLTDDLTMQALVWLCNVQFRAIQFGAVHIMRISDLSYLTLYIEMGKNHPTISMPFMAKWENTVPQCHVLFKSVM
jgi:hypothetical protein